MLDIFSECFIKDVANCRDIVAWYVVMYNVPYHIQNNVRYYVAYKWHIFGKTRHHSNLARMVISYGVRV